MSLKNEQTKWVLFLACSGEPETRHILDLAFGLHCLELAGIDPKDIFVYIDGQDRSSIWQWLSTGTKNNYTVKQSKDFFADQTNNTHHNLVMFVTGHGGISGIDAQTPISPYMLLKCIKESPSLIKAVLYLGQCQAGIFNYIGAGKNFAPPGGSAPDVIIVGATNLHDSLSSATQEQLANNPVNWLANLFLLHVFKWISKPIDVDGDGRCTVIDSYKYAGAMANSLNRDIKIGSFVRSFDLHEKWKIASNDHANQGTLQTKIALKAATSQYETELGVRYTHQESWILNAVPAQLLEY